MDEARVVGPRGAVGAVQAIVGPQVSDNRNLNSWCLQSTHCVPGPVLSALHAPADSLCAVSYEVAGTVEGRPRDAEGEVQLTRLVGGHP